ncbi:hypothetical protein [Salarchaeum japonicum]|uniref:hypothetical protein n=1 Tax=Salarchaeum japonicum TaxID=555573 RepID=UPI003C728022
MAVTRRWVARTVTLAALGLAGCTSSQDTGVSDIVVTNHTANEVAVTVRVVREDGTRVLDDTVSIVAGATQTYENPVPFIDGSRHCRCRERTEGDA